MTCSSRLDRPRPFSGTFASLGTLCVIAACQRPAAPARPAKADPPIEIRATTEAPALEPLASESPASAAPPSESRALEAQRSTWLDAVVSAPDRSAEDRALNAQRSPRALLSFYGLSPGMRVVELMAGKGYTTELLARSVGSEGVVYAQNNRFVL